MSRFSTLGTRALTATIFALVMLGGIYFSKISFLLLFAVILFLGLKELFQLSFYNDETAKSKYAWFGPILCISPFVMISLQKLEMVHIPDSGFSYLLLFGFPVFIAFIFELLANGMQDFSRISKIALGILYLTFPICLLADLAIYQEQFHPMLVLGLLFLIWINDTGAYFVGSGFGKRKLYPSISPGKSWEGSIGGAIITLIVAVFFPKIFGEYGSTAWIILGMIAIVFGTIGDLVESMLKRNVGVKDSGNMMPGHGGVLDRFDAFIFLIPFVYLYISYLRFQGNTP